MVRIGRLDRRIELKRFTLTMDGDPTSGSWTTVHTVWAEKMDKGGAERFVSAAEIAEATAVYRIRYLADVNPSWRLKHGTDLWDIEGTAEGKGRKREMLLLVSRHDPGDSSG